MRSWLTFLPWVTRQSWRNPNNGSDYYAAGRQERPLTKIVIHSTETVGFPGYRSGADNPHFTIHPVTGAVRQHVPLDMGARALQVSATRLANVGGVIQIEIIGAVTPGYPRIHGHYDLVNTLPNDARAMGYLARLLAAISAETGIPLRNALEWLTYPSSYGNTRVRLSVNGYLNYSGVLGHQHVPGNSHGDPGRLPIARLLELALGTPGRDGDTFSEGATGADVKSWQESLKTVGHALEADGIFGPITTRETRAFQAYRGIAVDGIVGRQTLSGMSTYMSALETKLDRLTADVAAMRREHAAELVATRREVGNLAGAVSKGVTLSRAGLTAVALSVWSYVNPGTGSRSAFWYLRQGLITNSAHRFYPADPGSPAEAELARAERESGEPVAERMARLGGDPSKAGK